MMFRFFQMIISDRGGENSRKNREEMKIFGEFISGSIKRINIHDSDGFTLDDEGDAEQRRLDFIHLFRILEGLLIKRLLVHMLNGHRLAGLKDLVDDPLSAMARVR